MEEKERGPGSHEVLRGSHGVPQGPTGSDARTREAYGHDDADGGCGVELGTSEREKGHQEQVNAEDDDDDDDGACAVSLEATRRCAREQADSLTY